MKAGERAGVLAQKWDSEALIMTCSLAIDWVQTCVIIGLSGPVSCCGSSCGHNGVTLAQ